MLTTWKVNETNQKKILLQIEIFKDFKFVNYNMIIDQVNSIRPSDFFSDFFLSMY